MDSAGVLEHEQHRKRRLSDGAPLLEETKRSRLETVAVQGDSPNQINKGTGGTTSAVPHDSSREKINTQIGSSGKAAPEKKGLQGQGGAGLTLGSVADMSALQTAKLTLTTADQANLPQFLSSSRSCCSSVVRIAIYNARCLGLLNSEPVLNDCIC